MSVRLAVAMVVASLVALYAGLRALVSAEFPERDDWHTGG